MDPRIENTSRLRRRRCIHFGQCGRRTCPAPDAAGSHHLLTSHPPMYSHSDMGQVPMLLHRAHRPAHGIKSSVPSQQSRSDTFGLGHMVASSPSILSRCPEIWLRDFYHAAVSKLGWARVVIPAWWNLKMMPSFHAPCPILRLPDEIDLAKFAG